MLQQPVRSSISIRALCVAVASILSVALAAPDAAVAAAPYAPAVTMNAAGGDGTGLRVHYGSGELQVVRNGQAQLFSPVSVPGDTPTMGNGFVLAVGNEVFGHRWTQWDSATATLDTVDGREQITSTLTATTVGADTFTVDLVLSMAAATDDHMQIAATVTAPAGNAADVRLYWVGDTYLQGGDTGAGFYDAGANPTVGVRKPGSAMSLQHVSGPQWAGYYSGRYTCYRAGANPSDCGGTAEWTDRGVDLANHIDPDASTDNGFGVNWDFGALVGASAQVVTAFHVRTPAELTASFAVDTIDPGTTTDLVHTVDNTASASALTDAGFSATLPAGMTVAGAASTTCTATVTAVTDSGTVDVAGLSAGAGATCTVTVPVTGDAGATYTHGSGNVTTDGFVVNSITDDTLTVRPLTASLTAAFGSDAVTVGRGTTLVYTLTNTYGADLAGLGFGIDLPDALRLQGTPTHTCDAADIALGDDFVVTGLAMSADDTTCTVTAVVLALQAGSATSDHTTLVSTTHVVDAIVADTLTMTPRPSPSAPAVPVLVPLDPDDGDGVPTVPVAPVIGEGPAPVSTRIIDLGDFVGRQVLLELTFDPTMLEFLPDGTTRRSLEATRQGDPGCAAVACRTVTVTGGSPTTAVDMAVLSPGVHDVVAVVEAGGQRHELTWQVRGVEVRRLAGPTRIETAIAGSQAAFADATAEAVVIARADDFADGQAGAPLAAWLDAPLLLAERDALPAATLAEVVRVLADGGTVHLLGGTAALSSAVEQALVDAGHTVVRHAGANRFATAATIAAAIDTDTAPVLADGGSFTDSLIAGALAAGTRGADGRPAPLLLTAGGELPTETAAALADPSAATAVGAGAAVAVPEADALLGDSPAALSVAVARSAFPDAATVAIARDDAFPDALSAGALLGGGRLGTGPLLLTGNEDLDAHASGWLTERPETVRALLMGGTAALPDRVAASVADALAG